MKIKLMQNLIDGIRGKNRVKKLKITGNKPHCKQKCIFLGNGILSCGKNVQFGYFPSADFKNTQTYIEARNPSAQIIVGDNTIINNHSIIVCNDTSIEIGKNCVIGINFQAFDSDFHGLKKEDRNNPDKIKNASIKIGNDVFIGNDVTILKGVTLGDGCVIGAKSVVTKDIPSNTIAVGNPAKILRKVED